MNERRTTGNAGEALAVKHLRAAGYVIIATGWRCGLGEVDIIAQESADWVFIEVRSRYDAEPGAAFESIGKRKKAKLIRLAQAYFNDRHLDNVAWRIDVVGVTFSRHQPA